MSLIGVPVRAIRRTRDAGSNRWKLEHVCERCEVLF